MSYINFKTRMRKNVPYLCHQQKKREKERERERKREKERKGTMHAFDQNSQFHNKKWASEIVIIQRLTKSEYLLTVNQFALGILRENVIARLR